MKDLQIKVDIGEITLDTIVSESYHQTGEEEYRQEPVTLGQMVADLTVEKLVRSESNGYFRDLSKRVQDVRDAVLREKLEPIIEKALSGEIRKTNVYGELTGKTTTLREEIMSTVERTLGKTQGTSTYDRQKTLLEQIIEKEVSTVLRKELNSVLAAEKEKVVNAVRAEGMKIFTDILEKGVRFP